MHRFTTALLALLLTALMTLPALAGGFFDRTPYRVYLQDETSLRELAQLRLDVDRTSVLDGKLTVDAFLNEDEVNLLKSLGYRVEAIPNLAYQGFLEDQKIPLDRRDPTRDYHTYQTLVSELQAIAEAHPTLCQLYSIGPTVQGRALWFMKISDNVSVVEDEPEFRYISSMHGDEVVGKEMCMYLINYLMDNYGIDPTVTNLVNEMEIWIMPSMNPDGTANGSRYNANGVDLNRDFPDQVSDPINTTAGRQIETANVMDWTFEHHPVISANLHCGTLVANYPWDHSFDPQAGADYTDNQDMVFAAAQAYAYNNPAMYNNNTPPFVHGVVNGVDWYQIDGGLQDWSYVWTGDMDITMEISNQGWPPASTLPGYWNDNRTSMLAYMQFAQRGVRGLVTSATTGQPLDAAVVVVGRSDFVTYTDPSVGDYHCVLMPGTYNVDIASPGYWPAHITNIPVTQGTAVRHDVQLEPADVMIFTGTLHSASGGGLAARLILFNGILNTPYDTTETNANGQFTFSNVYEGEYQLRILSLVDAALVQYPISLTSGMSPLELWGPVAVVYDGFEAGMTNWTAQGTWGTSGNAYAGTLSTSDSPSGNYGSNLNMSLTHNSQFDLTDYYYATLSYRIKFNYETNFDSLFIEVSTNGTTWNRLAFHNCKQDWWSLEVKDLAGYLTATNLRLRYRLWTDASVVRDGGFIDEVRLCAVSLSPIGQTVSVTLTPSGTPIQIPASGGSFNYNIAVANSATTPVTGDVWCNVTLPSGSVYGPTLGPVLVNLPAGASLNRDRTQSVPGAAPTGNYTYQAYIGDYPSTVWNQDSFPFVKLGVDGQAGGDWANTGESFPSELPAAAPLPDDYLLAQNFPNPFNPTTEIHFVLPQAGWMTLKVYNTAGQLVQLLADGHHEAGWHKITWEATNLATGLYLYQLTAGERTISQKAILIK